jgi:hypothetical protein
MQFRTRSLGRVLTDLTSKLEQLPSSHPERPALIRMIGGLKAELATRPGKGNDNDARDTYEDGGEGF